MCFSNIKLVLWQEAQYVEGSRVNEVWNINVQTVKWRRWGLKLPDTLLIIVPATLSSWGTCLTLSTKCPRSVRNHLNVWMRCKCYKHSWNPHPLKYGNKKKLKPRLFSRIALSKLCRIDPSAQNLFIDGSLVFSHWTLITR